MTIRYDPRDLAELRVFHRDRFLCRAVCQELASQRLSLQDLIRVRRTRLRELRTGLGERYALADGYLPRPTPPATDTPEATTPQTPAVKLKRYLNE